MVIDISTLLPTKIPIHHRRLLRELHDPIVPGLWQGFLAVSVDGLGGLGDAAEDAEEDINGCVNGVVLLGDGLGDTETDLPIEVVFAVVAAFRCFIAVWSNLLDGKRSKSTYSLALVWQ
jgi:hypothetical protein